MTTAKACGACKGRMLSRWFRMLLGPGKVRESMAPRGKFDRQRVVPLHRLVETIWMEYRQLTK